MGPSISQILPADQISILDNVFRVLLHWLTRRGIDKLGSREELAEQEVVEFESGLIIINAKKTQYYLSLVIE